MTRVLLNLNHFMPVFAFISVLSNILQQFAEYLKALIQIRTLERNELKTIFSTLRVKCPYLEFFWSVFSHIRTEYGEILQVFNSFPSNVPIYINAFKHSLNWCRTLKSIEISGEIGKFNEMN